ncbi:sterol carrier protein 2-like [Macrobrachium nipponense]|uniref:sterol carrier protein 2-like n=1 Tax=Macrobrachium nipponense TaxID=159736 RepID=UPI0030C7C80E
MAQRRVFVVGVGMTKFEKPGRRDDFGYPVMAREAVEKALDDAKVKYNEIEQAAVGYVYGDSTSGQRALYEVGMTGIPVYNVNNNCSTGSTALLVARNLIRGGLANCVLALGFEKMERGSLKSKYLDRENPVEKHVHALANAVEMDSSPLTPQLFGNAGIEHMKKYGTTPKHLAKIAYKNHLHSTNNPYSQFQEKYTLEEIEKSPIISGYLTKLQCCPTSDGAGAAILASEEFVKSHGLQNQAVEIVGMEMATDTPSTFGDSPMKIVGYDMTKNAAERLFRGAGISPTDVDVVELHDCFSANELITYEALGLCGEGEAGKLIDSGNNTYGGKYVINPSGGLISKGHPLGATGLAQCAELCWQLRGKADKRQVPNAKVALQHNVGLGGAVVVTLYKMGFRGNERSIVAAATAAGGEFQSTQIFDAIKAALDADGANLVKKVKGVFCFHVKGGPNGSEAKWIVDAKNGNGSVEKDGAAKPDVTITMTDKDLVDLMTGALNPQKAFFQGKLKIKGNMGLAMKLQEFQKSGDVPKAKL